MRKRFATLLPCLAIGLVMACQAPAAPAALADADIAGINAVTNEFVQAIRASNFAAVAALYTQDGVILPPNGPTVTGRAAIQAFLESFPPVTEFNLTNADVFGSGDLAVVHGTYAMTLSPPGAPPIPDTGKYIEIRRRQADGRWLISHDIFNSNVPLPGGM